MTSDDTHLTSHNDTTHSHQHALRYNNICVYFDFPPATFVMPGLYCGVVVIASVYFFALWALIRFHHRSLSNVFPSPTHAITESTTPSERSASHGNGFGRYHPHNNKQHAGTSPPLTLGHHDQQVTQQVTPLLRRTFAFSSSQSYPSPPRSRYTPSLPPHVAIDPLTHPMVLGATRQPENSNDSHFAVHRTGVRTHVSRLH